MTNAEMLAYVRTYLDESSESFYLDDEEIYPALTNAQIEVGDILIKKWRAENRNNEVSEIPLTLQPLVTNTTSLVASGASSVSIPTVWELINLKWTPSLTAHSTYPKTQNCIMISPSQVNRYLQNPLTKDGFYVWRKNQTFYMNPPASITNAVATYDNFKTLSYDIDATHSAELHEVSHQAICERALWLLLKDRESDQAQLHEQKSMALIGELV